MPLHLRSTSRIGARVSPRTRQLLADCMVLAQALGVAHGAAEYVLNTALSNRVRRLRAACRSNGIDPWDAIGAVRPLAPPPANPAPCQPQPRVYRYDEDCGRDSIWIRRPWPQHTLRGPAQQD